MYLLAGGHFADGYRARGPQPDFKAPAPASTVLEVRQLVHPDWLIEIEAVAYLPVE